jgi:hypothetical protein
VRELCHSHNDAKEGNQNAWEGIQISIYCSVRSRASTHASCRAQTVQRLENRCPISSPQKIPISANDRNTEQINEVGELFSLEVQISALFYHRCIDKVWKQGTMLYRI